MQYRNVLRTSVRETRAGEQINASDASEIVSTSAGEQTNAIRCERNCFDQRNPSATARQHRHCTEYHCVACLALFARVALYQ